MLVVVRFAAAPVKDKSSEQAGAGHGFSIMREGRERIPATSVLDDDFGAALG